MTTGQRALWRSLQRQSNRALPAIGARCGLALAAAVVSAALLLGASAATAQTVRALVIGIDDYVEHQDLAGAVNDARDLASTLSRAASTTSWCWRMAPQRGTASPPNGAG